MSSNRRSSGYSTRSIGGSSGISLSGGMQSFGGGSSRRMSSGSFISAGYTGRARAPSVYGGAGGYGTRISQSVFSASPSMAYYGGGGGGGGGGGYGFAVGGNEKSTMQNLNDRLGSYLDKVRTLEAANRKLEQLIKEFYEKRSPVYGTDLTAFFGTISDLRVQLLRKFKENHLTILQVDNARLAADDFRMKFETELSMRTAVEADLVRMRGVLGSLTLARSDLEVQIEGLKEELVYIKRNHEEEMLVARAQQGGAVNVEVDCAESPDLNKVLTEIRELYETMVHKNQCEVEKWFQTKVEGLQTHIVTSTTEVNTYLSEVNELKRVLQSLEIELQAQVTTKQCLEQSLAEVSARYNVQLSQLQLCINTLEVELQQLNVSIQQQAVDYQMLLDLKMRLELEIAEYRRLMDGEGQNRGVIISTSTRQMAEVKVKKEVVKREVVEEHKPRVERRVRTIVEEIIDGEVVSTTRDTEMENHQQARRGSSSSTHDTQMERRGSITSSHDTQMERRGSITSSHDTQMERRGSITSSHDTQMENRRGSITSIHDTQMENRRGSITSIHDTQMENRRGSITSIYDTQIDNLQQARRGSVTSSIHNTQMERRGSFSKY